MKKQLLLIPLLAIATIFVACKQQSPKETTATTGLIQKPKYQKLQGKTMGTTWHITFEENTGKDRRKSHQQAIDSVLLRINQEVSTYIDSAIISRFNQSEKGVAINVEQHAHFIRNYKAALGVFQETDGLFDPTVMPLVNFWGFGYTGRDKVKEVSKKEIQGLLNFVGMDHVNLNEQSFLTKDQKEVQLDFSALAKGYGVDQICHYFDLQGIEHYFVEIGGEVNTKGKNPSGSFWTVGISRPEQEAAPQDFFLTMKLNNKALATSGNYRNVYQIGNVHYFHTIDPRSGYPKGDRLLSASVLTDNCMMADAYATAFMVMGLEEAMAFAKKNPKLGVCFIFSDEKGGLDLFLSDGMEGVVERVKDNRY